MPIDLNCIRDELVRQLSGLFTDLELDAVRDPKEKLVGRMYLNKVRGTPNTNKTRTVRGKTPSNCQNPSFGVVD